MYTLHWIVGIMVQISSGASSEIFQSNSSCFRTEIQLTKAAALRVEYHGKAMCGAHKWAARFKRMLRRLRMETNKEDCNGSGDSSGEEQLASSFPFLVNEIYSRINSCFLEFCIWKHLDVENVQDSN